jgi:hypothetical protein
MDMYAPKEYKRACIHPNQKHMELKHKPHYHLTTLNHLKRKEYSKFKKNFGSILHYAGAVDMRVLMALRSIASEQMKATEKRTHGVSNSSTILHPTQMQKSDSMHPT